MTRFPVLRCWPGVLVLVGGLTGGCANQPPVPNGLPRSWNLEEIEKASPPREGTGQVYALAWKVEQDEQGHRVESCLTMRVLDWDDGEGRWCLGCLSRDPDAEKPKWRLPTVHVTGKPGTEYFPGLWIPDYHKRFKGRPGNKEVYDSVSAIGWSFTQRAGRKIVGCGVCEESWQAALGEKPTEFFGN
jgi:hypothetical protein